MTLALLAWVEVLGVLLMAASHFWNTLPPVSSGDRIKATGACVATACLMERSRMNSSSSRRVMV
jgi:hypothetical protein